jgi:large repetitive protein
MHGIGEMMQNHAKKKFDNHGSTNVMAAIVIGAILVFSVASMKGALADTIENTIAADVTRNTIDAGGSTTATYYVKVQSAREEGTGGANACNPDDGTSLKIDVNFPSGVKATVSGSEQTSPITLEFNRCGEGSGKQITFSSDTAGKSYQITTNNIRDSGVGLYTDNSDFTLTVRAASDTTAPTLQLPNDITEEATDPDGRVITYTATATDNVDGDVEVNCTPASGSTFKLGETTVNCSATDAAENEATGSFKVTITEPADTTKPVLNLPDDITKEATGPGGAEVTYTATATDNGQEIEVTCEPPSGSTFKLGETTVNCSATDAAENEATGSFVVRIQDTTAPTLQLPNDIAQEATGPGGAAITYTATATDNVDGDVEVTCEPPSGSTFKVGTTTVSCSATDASGNTSPGGTFSITIQDTTAPTLQLPSNIAQEATGPGGAAITYTATATDLVDGTVTVTCTPASGSTFKLGETTVNCSAKDVAENEATGSFTVTVRDTTAPELTYPTDSITKEATGASGAVVDYEATATDLVDGTVTVTCTPASGSTFKLGETTVNCSATDAAENEATGSFTVTVRDTTAPTLQLPSNIAQKATGPGGAAITYTATASDLVDNAPTVTCTPASGSEFKLGTTTVSCSATDASGNTSPAGTFKVTVTLTIQGFYQPVDNNGVYNLIKAGSTVPLKFEVFAGSTELTDISIRDTVTLKKVSCPNSPSVDEVEEYITTGQTTFRYDTTSGQFIDNMKSPTTKGTCHQVTMTFDDGSPLVALFKTK